MPKVEFFCRFSVFHLLLRGSYGFFRSDLSVFLPAGSHSCDEAESPVVAQHGAVSVQPSVLRLGGTGLRGADADGHPRELSGRASGRCFSG